MNNSQISERFTYSDILAIVGGFFGAYSYVLRGGVFASAQTGNIILLGLKFANGDFSTWYQHVLPIIIFCLGVMFAELISLKYFESKFLHWQQIVLLIEIFLVITISLIPIGNLNLIANMLIGFTSGLQTQSIRKPRGIVLLTTMCTGNLRTISEHLFHTIHQRNYKKFITIFKEFSIIFFFLLGVIIGGILSPLYGDISILFTLPFIFLVFCLMFFKNKGYE